MDTSFVETLLVLADMQENLGELVFVRIGAGPVFALA